MINAPLVGWIDAVDHEPDEVAHAIRKELASHGVWANLAIKRVYRPDEGYRVYGAVGNPQIIQFSQPPTLAALLRLVEPLHQADLQSVEIETWNGRKKTVDATASGGLILVPGDAIKVGLLKTANEALVLGAVAKPGSQPWSPGLTAEQAIANAGGFTADADQTNATRERAGKTEPLNKTEVLQRGDVIRIPIAEGAMRVSVIGAVKRPGIVRLKPGSTLWHALLAAGGFQERGDRRKVIVRGQLGTGKPLIYDMTKIKMDGPADPVLKPGEIVEATFFGKT